MEKLSIDLLGMSIELVGGIMIAYTVLKVHYRVRREHKIDQFVFKTMRKEQSIGIWGIILLIIGYLLQVFSLF